jgi:hypothetical protein
MEMSTLTKDVVFNQTNNSLKLLIIESTEQYLNSVCAKLKLIEQRQDQHYNSLMQYRNNLLGSNVEITTDIKSDKDSMIAFEKLCLEWVSVKITIVNNN